MYARLQMKRQVIRPSYACLLLVLSLLTACAPQEKQLDPRLIELQQIKLGQIEQVNVELNDLRTEIQSIESELSQPVEMKSINKMTLDELRASIRRPGLEARLTQLKSQESNLLIKKGTTCLWLFYHIPVRNNSTYHKLLYFL